jgi:hypothetical protein
MAISDFYPFVDGQKITAAQWNELFGAVASGALFNDDTFIGGQIEALANRVTALELRMDYLYNLRARQRKRQQFVLTQGQTTIVLDNVPMVDSEMVSVNGQVWSKTGIPEGFVGDYSISEKTISINPDQAINIVAGDVFVVSYEFEV